MPDENRLAPEISAGFPPIVAPGARLLILGSLPSRKSLAMREYYAHAQNAFWRIMGELFDAGPALPYAERTRRLVQAGIAVWDVLASSVRPGSLDSAIRPETAAGNEFSAFFKRYPGIATVCFNGKKAQQLFARLIDGRAAALAGREYRLLPSTSPAHAAMSYAEKLQAWSVVRSAAGGSHQ